MLGCDGHRYADLFTTVIVFYWKSGTLACKVRGARIAIVTGRI